MSFRPVGSAAPPTSQPAPTPSTAIATAGPSKPEATSSGATTAPAETSTPTIAASYGPSYPAASTSSSYGPQIPTSGIPQQQQQPDYSSYAQYNYTYPGAGAGAVAGPSSYGAYGAGGYDTTGYGQYGAGGGSGYSAYSASAGSFGTTDEELMAQQSIYTPDNAASQQFKVKAQKGQARTTVLRKGAGEVWEDATLMEWDPSHFRLFIGDLGNDVNEDDLIKAFGPEKGWSSFVKAKVVRDKVTNKTRGYGFVSYSDPEDFMKAWKAMNGKYVGSRPVKIQKASTTVRQVNIGDKKAKELDTKKKSHTIGNKVRGTIAPSGSWKPYIRR